MNSLWALYGAGSLGRYLWACEGEGIWMLNQPDCLLLPLRMTCGKVVIYLNFKKDFDMGLKDIFVSCVGSECIDN